MHTFQQSYWGTRPLLSQCSPPSSPGTWWVGERSQTPCTSSPRSRSCAWVACSLRCTWRPGNQQVQWSSTASRWARGSWWSTFPCSRCPCFGWHRSHRESCRRKGWIWFSVLKRMGDVGTEEPRILYLRPCLLKSIDPICNFTSLKRLKLKISYDQNPSPTLNQLCKNKNKKH